jgi:hypothetical protein
MGYGLNPWLGREHNDRINSQVPLVDNPSADTNTTSIAHLLLLVVGAILVAALILSVFCAVGYYLWRCLKKKDERQENHANLHSAVKTKNLTVVRKFLAHATNLNLEELDSGQKLTALDYAFQVSVVINLLLAISVSVWIDHYLYWDGKFIVDFLMG